MKRFLTVLFALSAAVAAFAQTNSQPQQVSIEIDGYAARVNDRVITKGEVREAMAPILPELYRTYQGDQLEEELEKAFNRARDELVERALIMEAFKARGGQIPEQYVKEEVERVIKERFKGDEALFEQLLAQQKKTRQEYHDMVRDQLAVGAMIAEEVEARARHPGTGAQGLRRGQGKLLHPRKGQV